MAWSDAARQAARLARRLKGGPSAIEKRYRRTVRGTNVNNQNAVKISQTLEKLESKTDSWGREKHAVKQIALQEKRRAIVARVRRWRAAQNEYRSILGKDRIKG